MTKFPLGFSGKLPEEDLKGPGYIQVPKANSGFCLYNLKSIRSIHIYSQLFCRQLRKEDDDEKQKGLVFQVKDYSITGSPFLAKGLPKSGNAPNQVHATMQVSTTLLKLTLSHFHLKPNKTSETGQASKQLLK